MPKGKWALVTGATAGLGFAVAESLAGAGANIVLHDLIEPKEASDRLRERFGVQVVSVAADLTQRASIETMMADLLGRIEAIDILVNNAVVRHFAPVEEFAPEHWEEALAVNLSAPFHLIRLALPAMKKHGWGRIINMASIYSTRAVANRIDYVTTKTAILGLTRAVAIETTTSGITCNAISPGTLPTPAIQAKIEAIAAGEGRSIDETTRDYLAARQPTGQFVAMERVGAMVVFLSGAAAQDITGASLPMDGGLVDRMKRAELPSTLRIADVPTVRSMVAQKLREAIMSGTLKPGQRLIERELCEMTGVSRPSIREALRLLEADGLVSTVPHRGPVVSTISLEEARQLYAARAVLEGFAGRECARLRDPAVVRRIGDALARLKAAFAANDLLTALEAKTEFYAALIDGCQNTFIERMLRPLHDRITLLRITSMAHPKRINKSLREVTAIWRAIQNGDADLTERCCVDHVRAAAVAALSMIERSSAVEEKAIADE